MNIDIRRSVAADAAQACVVLRRSIVECCTLDHGGDPAMLEPWLRNKTPDNLLNWIEDRDNVFLVAEAALTLIGVALLKADGTVALCYLLPEARFLGVGKALMLKLEAEATSLGLEEMRLSSTRTGYPFYQRNGFIDIGPGASPFGLDSRRMLKKLC